MADITYGISLNVNKGYLSNSVSVQNVTANMSVAGLKSLTYTLTTNASSISTANLASAGIAFLRNVSTATSATVQIGIQEGGSFVTFTSLNPGEPQLFRVASSTNYVAIGAAGARLRVDILEG